MVSACVGCRKLCHTTKKYTLYLKCGGFSGLTRCDAKKCWRNFHQQVLKISSNTCYAWINSKKPAYKLFDWNTVHANQSVRQYESLVYRKVILSSRLFIQIWLLCGVIKFLPILVWVLFCACIHLKLNLSTPLQYSHSFCELIQCCLYSIFTLKATSNTVLRGNNVF